MWNFEWMSLSCEHMKTKKTDNQYIVAQNPLTMHDTKVDNDGDLDDTGMLHEEREYMWGDYVTPHPPIHPTLSSTSTTAFSCRHV